MGLMKHLHTKGTEKPLVGDERLFALHNEERNKKVVPDFLDVEIPGQPRRLVYGFPKFVIDRLLRDGQVYFISWSGNFRDYMVFSKNPAFYDLTKFEDAKAGKGLIDVTVQGPFDAAGFTEAHVPYSSVKSMEEYKQGADNWYAHNSVIQPHPLYLWLAKR